MAVEAEELEALRERLYESYTSTHAGLGNTESTALVYRRAIRPLLPSPDGQRRVLDIGCGQGTLVRLLREDGFDASGVDISPEQVAAAQSTGLDQVVAGDFRTYLAREPASWDVIVATDLLEHLNRYELIEAFDQIHRALAPGGMLVARIPNAVSPTGGHIMFGDLTHETWFTPRSVTQLATVTGFAAIRTRSCPPIPHGVKSAARAMAFGLISSMVKLMLASETGQLHGHIVTQNFMFQATKAA